MTPAHVWRAARIGIAIVGLYYAGKAFGRHLKRIEREAQCW